jgi:D-lyxose ketol-isomerase
MLRSEINQIMRDALRFIGGLGHILPPFALWGPAEWADKGAEYDEIRDNMLGWDITDFGGGDYRARGLLMFTTRNGNYKLASKYAKPYAEKYLITGEEQITPFHFHWNKMEDIINRGGGNLLVKVRNSSKDGAGLLDTPVTVYMDGRRHQVEAGAILRVGPGESITLPSGQYHEFWGEKGRGQVLLGEVSKVNDDVNDNRFYEKVGRFPKISEDEKPLYLLCNEFPRAK